MNIDPASPMLVTQLLAVRIPAELHHQLKRVAFERNAAQLTELTTMTAITMAALREWLDAHNAQSKARIVR